MLNIALGLGVGAVCQVLAAGGDLVGMTANVAALRSSEIELSPHSASRFRNRVKPALSVAAAARELEQLVAQQGLIKLEPPGWLARRMRAEPADFYVLIGDCIALPVRRIGGSRFGRFVAVTCLVRTAISDEARRRRNTRAQSARARRRADRHERRAGGTRRRRTTRR